MNNDEKLEYILKLLKNTAPVQRNAEAAADAIISRIKSGAEKRKSGKLFSIIRTATAMVAAALVVLFIFQTYYIPSGMDSHFSKIPAISKKILPPEPKYESKNALKNILILIKENERESNISKSIVARFSKPSF